MAHLDFEAPLVELEERIATLRALTESGAPDAEEIETQIQSLEAQAERLQRELYADLDVWKKVQLSRHPDRPYLRDYIGELFTDFVELHGDRLFRDDPAIIAGFARFESEIIAIIGHQKGRTAKDKGERNFGMAHPEGYRKAIRVMKLAEQAGRPLLAFIDTPGAYPGLGAEERGQAEAIATNLREMARLRVPTVSVVIGEGGSGGALALGVTDRIVMLEHSIYSVISPEGCAAILWRSAEHKEKAAEALKITSSNLVSLGVADDVIAEPPGGAHADWAETARRVKDGLVRHLAELTALDQTTLLERRWAKYEGMGMWLGEDDAGGT